MKWETPMPNVMLEILNTFLIKGTYFYFGHNDNVYVINKQLIVNVFRVCAKGCVEKLKGYVNKSLEIQILQSYRLAPANSSAYNWNAKSLGVPYSVKYLAIIYVIY
jgi:hypothetical protein